MKSFRFNLGSLRILVQLVWREKYPKIAIRKYEVGSLKSVPEIERFLLRRLKTTVRGRNYRLEGAR